MNPGSDPRQALLRELVSRGTDQRVLDAFAAVDRSDFIAPELHKDAWRNEPLPIGEAQTMSQPLLVASMCGLLRLEGHERVLDVGTGSGYHAALLGRLARTVVSIERHPSLAETARANLDAARANLAAAGLHDVEVVVGDGSRGYPPQAPYEAINVAAASSEGALGRLARQLSDGGRLVAPTAGDDQRLIVLERRGEKLIRTDHGGVRFVPLVGDDE